MSNEREFEDFWNDLNEIIEYSDDDVAVGIAEGMKDFIQDQRTRNVELEATIKEQAEEIGRRNREIEVLRMFGNPTCTAKADDVLIQDIKDLIQPIHDKGKTE